MHYYDHAPEFDNVYVISDLHMGGDDVDFQIFNQGNTLAALIDYFAEDEPEKRKALVINGDTVDFLAEKPFSYFDAPGAITKLERIINDESFNMVFESLQKFVAKKNRVLAITLGNHDLELALPWVQEYLLNYLTKKKVANRGRIRLCFDGTGFSCTVNGRRILCHHGNEVDMWNVTDYEALRRYGRDEMQGSPPREWAPNAGTQIVIDIMNEIKRKRPFVDLLKPEIEAVLPVLIALDPKLSLEIPKFGKPLAKKFWDGLRKKKGFLSADDMFDNASMEFEDTAVEAEFQSLIRETFGTDAELVDEVEIVRNKVERDLIERSDPRFEAGSEADELLLFEGIGEGIGAVRDHVRGFGKKIEPRELLRRALVKLHNDQMFNADVPDTLSDDMRAMIGSKVDVLVTGHTHQRKALERSGDYYFNSGTWVRLIELTKERLEKGKFATVYDGLDAPTLTKLDKATDHNGNSIVRSRPCFIRISAHSSGLVNVGPEFSGEEDLTADITFEWGAQ